MLALDQEDPAFIQESMSQAGLRLHYHVGLWTVDIPLAPKINLENLL